MYERSRVNVKVEPRSTFTFYAWPFIHYLYVIYARKFYVRSHGKITRQSQPLTKYNIQKQRINWIETEDIEFNNYMCIPYHFTIGRKAWNFTKRFHADKFRIIYACILIKIKIYVYFCNNIVFLKEKN